MKETILYGTANYIKDIQNIIDGREIASMKIDPFVVDNTVYYCYVIGVIDND